jgi:hypothetical protein
MVCSAEGCEATHWAGHAVEEAEKLGWRHHRDGKEPRLGIGIALCPKDVGRAGEFLVAASAPQKGARR